jgi:hypothetical protein
MRLQEDASVYGGTGVSFGVEIGPHFEVEKLAAFLDHGLFHLCTVIRTKRCVQSERIAVEGLERNGGELA